MDRTTSAAREPGRSSRQVEPGIATAFALAVAIACSAGAAAGPGFDLDVAINTARGFGRAGLDWYQRTPATDRMTWGGIAAASMLGLGVSLRCLVRLRRKRILPDEFSARFLERLKEGRLDRGKALDFCELNSSPASRVALAAVKRWGRPVTDLERAVSLAHRVEVGRLRKNIGTLRRLAAISPLLGLLGTLFAIARTLSTLGAEAASPWGPAIASSLGPLTAGVAVAVLALVAFDGLTVKAESLIGALDLAGAETIDAVAMALPSEPRTIAPVAHGPARTPHQIRIEAPHPSPRPIAEDHDFD